MTVDQDQHKKWSSTWLFLLAAIGAAVGLGNLWRFPFMVGQNGGSAFVIVYLGFIVLLAVPIMSAELMIGRLGKASPVNTICTLVKREGANPAWQCIGWLSLAVPLLGLSFYSIVAGWSLEYIGKAATGAFSGYDGATSEANFSSLLASPWRLLTLHTLFIALAVFVAARGLHRGIETLIRYMMPLLFLTLLAMVLNSIFAADIEAGLNYLFAPNFEKLTAEVIFMALGQAFFSVAIGVGMLMTYGAYLPDDTSITKSALMIAGVDTMVALFAGIAIFPLVFTYGLNASEGPGLIFVTLPIAFGQMPGGWLLGLVFFLLLLAAAFTTAIGMLEPVVSYLEEHKGVSRRMMAIVAGGSSWFIGIGAALSFNLWTDFKPMAFLPLVQDKSIFDLLDFIVSNLMLPLNGLLIALFAGWVISPRSALEGLSLTEGALFHYWLFVLRYVAPLAIGLIFITSF